MQVHTLPKKVGAGLLLAALLNSACALPRPTGQSQLNPAEAPPVATRPEPGAAASVIARISPEDAATRAVNTLTPTDAGYQLRHPYYTATFTGNGVTFQPKRGEVRWQWHLITVETAAGPLTGVKAGEVRPEQPAPQTVVYHRGVLDEQYVARKGSIEQQFVIPQPLVLQGADLRIRGQVQSGGVLETRDERWVWRGEHKGVWLGQVYVYDAQGNALPSRLEVSQGETTIVIEGQGLAQAVYPVVVDPEIGVNDFRISDMGPDGNALFGAFHPAVAYNSTNNQYLVVWRGNDNTDNLVDDEYEIFGQRIDGATGAEIGVNDFRISDMGYQAEAPAVAYNSTNNEYLVVWSGLDTELPDEYEIFGQRLAGATGAQVGVDDFRISHMGPDGDFDYDAFDPAVAYNSTNNQYLVVWSGVHYMESFTKLEYEVFGQRLAGATGAKVGVNDFGISHMHVEPDPADDSGYAGGPVPAVAYNSTNNQYLVVWWSVDNPATLANERQIYGQRLTGKTGAEVGVDDFPVSAMADVYQALAVAYNPTNNEYLAVWSGSLSKGGKSEIYGQRLAGVNGAEVGVNDFPISNMGADPNSDLQAFDPKMAYNNANNEYLVVWESGAYDLEIYGQRLAGASGAKVGVNDFPLSDMGPDGDWNIFYVLEPAVAYNSTNHEYLAVWEAQNLMIDPGASSREFEIYGQRWSTCGDGIVDPGEECEPGHNISFGGVDSCTPMCTINLCGNGVVDEDEDCDLGSSNGLPDSQCTLTCQHPSILNLERLHDLVASCEICPPEVRASLADILAHAQLQLSKGKERQTIKTLQQFTKKVQHFLSKGRLPDAEGRQLQMQAEVIIAQLQEQLAGR